MFVIRKDNKVVLADNDRNRLEKTLKHIPYLQSLKIEETSEDWKIINGEYRLGDLTLDELKLDKRVEINQTREQARKTEGALYNDDLFDIDETSQSNILAQIKVAELLNNSEATYTYRSKTNQNHSFTVTQLQELGLAIAQKVNEIYQKSWDLKAQVDAAETEEEIKNIAW